MAHSFLVDHDLKMNGTDSIQIIPVNILSISSAHDIDKNISSNILKVSKHKRRSISVLVLVRKVVERNKADLSLASTVRGE